jgi:CHAT domain-containing protein
MNHSDKTPPSTSRKQYNYEEAAKWFRKAADQGHMKAQYALGQLYEAGLGIVKDRHAARRWFEKAAAQGHKQAARRLDALQKPKGARANQTKRKKSLPEIIDIIERKRAPTMDIRFILSQQQVIGDEKSLHQVAGKGSSGFSGLKPGLMQSLLDPLTPAADTEEIPVKTLLGQYLTEDRAILAYYQAKDRLMVVAGTKNQGMSKILPFAEKELAARLYKLQQDLEISGLMQAQHTGEKRDLGAAGAGSIDEKKAVASNWHDELRQLYTDLIGPVESVLKKVKRIYILPHGPTLLCPFAALIDPYQCYLIERMEIVYAPTLKMVSNSLRHEMEIQQKTWAGLSAYSKKARGCFIGNPDGTLPGAEQECSKLADLALGDDDFLLRGKDASIHYLKTWGTAFGRCAFLHMACHAVYNPKQPELSYLQLAPEDGKDDGRLTFDQIQYLDLKTVQLVTLSACCTAVGDPRMQKEVNWLAIAFLMGGAQSVIGTQWKVDDAYTPQFMVNLYRSVKKEAVATCLRKAMITAIDDGVHPYVWAPFILMGEPGPLIPEVVRFRA